MHPEYIQALRDVAGAVWVIGMIALVWYLSDRDERKWRAECNKRRGS